MYTIYFDGSCKTFKGIGKIATYGWVLYSPTNLLIKQGFGECIFPNYEDITNNSAEFFALVKALEYLFNEHIKVDVLLCKGDSKLVVEQVHGRWKCKKTHLYKLKNRVKTLLSQVCETWYLEWIPRRENKVADELSKKFYKINNKRLKSKKKRNFKKRFKK